MKIRKLMFALVWCLRAGSFDPCVIVLKLKTAMVIKLYAPCLGIDEWQIIERASRCGSFLWPKQLPAACVGISQIFRNLILRFKDVFQAIPKDEFG